MPRVDKMPIGRIFISVCTEWCLVVPACKVDLPDLVCAR